MSQCLKKIWFFFLVQLALKGYFETWNFTQNENLKLWPAVTRYVWMLNPSCGTTWVPVLKTDQPRHRSQWLTIIFMKFKLLKWPSLPCFPILVQDVVSHYFFPCSDRPCFRRLLVLLRAKKRSRVAHCFHRPRSLSHLISNVLWTNLAPAYADASVMGQLSWIAPCSCSVPPVAFRQAGPRTELRRWGQLLLLTRLPATSYPPCLPEALSWNNYHPTLERKTLAFWILFAATQMSVAMRMRLLCSGKFMERKLIPKRISYYIRKCAMLHCVSMKPGILLNIR